jgi:DNA-binding GntR family transcriptional regulator
MDAIRQQVLSGELPGGTFLREGELCKSFGVSRYTARTALQELAHEGIVCIAPNRGASVPNLHVVDINDIYRMRTLMEVAAARAVSGDTERLKPAQEAVAALKSIPEDAAWGIVRDKDLAFHQALVDAIRSPRASQMFLALLSEIRLGFVQIRPEFEDHATIARQHARILGKLKRGQTEAAVNLITRHLEDARRALVRASER